MPQLRREIMGKDSAIEWTDHTFNAWWGCTKISAGCANCYAQDLAERFGYNGCFGKGQPRKHMSDKYWAEPLKWDRAAAKAGKRARVFCASMGDVFDLEAPMRERARLWKLIEATPNLQWLALTKRIESLWVLSPMTWLSGSWPENVAVGVTVENQAVVKRVAALVEMKKRYGIPMVFVSVEPMLGPVWLESLPDWVICGGESGINARPMNPNWARGLRDQCNAAGVPFLFKQWGEWGALEDHPETMSNIPICFYDESIVGTIPGWQNGLSSGGQQHMVRIGKKKAGRLLDGKEWNQYPEDRG